MGKSVMNNNGLRDLIDSRFDALRLETKGDLKDIYDKIDELDRTVQKNALKQAVSSTKIGMLITGITLSVSAITTVVINLIRGKAL